MLTIFKAADPKYYAKYLETGKIGDWAGSLKPTLNLPDEVTEKHYWNLIRGYSPDGKTRLYQDNGRNHMGAQDFTFSACKSASLTMVLNKDELVEAHEKAVDAAISFLEEKAAFTRRGKNGYQLEKVHSLLVSKHTHYESRAEQPQLHTHCLVYNLCERDDGSWGTLNYQHFYKWKMAAGAIYRCQFAQNLRKLGYELTQEGDFFEITGISDELIEEYSAREREISEKLNKLRLKNSSNRTGDKLSMQGRQSKSTLTTEELFEKWTKEIGSLAPPKRSLDQDSISAQMYVLPTEVLKELTTQKTYFREQDLYQRLAIKGQASFLTARDVKMLADRTKNSDRVIKIGFDKSNNQCFTTPEALQAEQTMIQQAIDLSNTKFFMPIKFASSFEVGLNKAEERLGFELDDEQVVATKLATNTQQLVLIAGTAGTGKSTSFLATKYIYAERGQSIIGASVSKKAADALAESADISTFTVDKLITQYKTGFNRLQHHASLIVDEASLLTVFQLNMLFKMASETKTKIVLAGDPFQLQAIEQAGAFNYLLNNGIAQAAQLENIRRQSSDWSRTIVNQFKVGTALPAFIELHEKGFVTFNEGYVKTLSSLVDKYFSLEEANPDMTRLVLAKSWRDVKAISQLIRDDLQKRKLVKEDIVELECSVSDKTFKQKFAVGDRVRLSKNDYPLGLSNGMQGAILDIKKNRDDWVFRIELDDKREVLISTNDYKSEEGNFSVVQAYASTIYSAQGLTVDSSLILANSYFDRANSYVAGSRHKQACHWFFNSEETDLSLLSEGKDITERTRLEAVASWCERDEGTKLASEFLQHEKELTKSHQKNL